MARDSFWVRALWCLPVASAFASGLPVNAVAQEAGARADEEIVVTATRREERIEDVPLSIQAITGDELGRIGAVNFTDYARTVAGVSFVDDGPGRSQIFIRGVSSGADIDTGKDAVVGMYIDETPISESSAQPDLKLYDINHVEVLRGPQGTLYGSGSLGGAVRVLTNRPDPGAFSADLQAIGSSTENGGVNNAYNGHLNIPLGEDAAVRVVAYTLHNSGFIDNGLTGEQDMGDEDTSGGRLTLRVTPTDTLDIAITGYYQDTQIDSYNRQTDHYPALVLEQSSHEPLSDEIAAMNVSIDWDLGFANLTSSSSYFDRTRNLQNDVDAALGAAFGGALGFDFVSELTYEAATLAQEVRLASSGDDRFRWLVGAYYQDRQDDFTQPINFGGSPPPPTVADNLYIAFTDLQTVQTAGFAEVSYDLTERLTATLGVRTTHVTREMSGVRDGVFYTTITGLGRIEVSGEGEETSTTPKLNVSYRTDGGSLFYAQATQGFRVGGVNVLPPCIPLVGCSVTIGDSFDSDTLWNYEVGMRTALFDDALRLSGSVFRIDWSDIQLNVPRGDNFNGIVNLGDARSQGVELEFNGQAGEHWRYGGQVTYTDAELTRVDPLYVAIATPGTSLPQVPELSAAANVEWGTTLGDDGWIYVRGDGQFVGERRSGLGADSEMADEYTLWNVRAGWDRGDIDFALFVNNLTDERAILSRTTTNGLLAGGPVAYDRITINTPRTVGLSLSKRF